MELDKRRFFQSRQMRGKFGSNFGASSSSLTTTNADAWKDFNSPYSIDITAVPECSYLKPFNHKNSIAYQLATDYKKITGKPLLNFFPFKFVPLKWLLDTENPLHSTKGYKKTYYAGTTLGGSQNGFRYTFRWHYGEHYIQLGGVYQNFTGNEKWLPLGDLAFAIKGDKAGEGATDIASNIGDEANNIIVALVYNDPSYCYKITAFNDVLKNNYYNDVGQSDDCDDIDESNQKDLWYYYPKNKSQSVNSNPHTFLASVYRYYYNNDDLWDRPNGSNFAGVAVNSNYTVSTDSGFYWLNTDNESNCDDNFQAGYTSPFYTVAIRNSFGTSMQDMKTQNGGNDLVPMFAYLIQCNNSPGYVPIKALESLDCKIMGNTICTGDISGANLNLLPTSQCIDYFKLSTTADNYTERYQKFCKDLSGNVPNYKTDEYKQVCQCFLPAEEYTTYLRSLTEGLPDTQANLVTSAISDDPSCFYPTCAVNNLKTYDKLKNKVSCKNIQLQNCVNVFDLSSGSISNSEVIPKQVNQCYQSGTGSGGSNNGTAEKIDCVVSGWTSCVNGKETRIVTTQPSGGGAACPTDLIRSCTAGSGSSNKGIIIGSIIGVVVLIVIIIFFFVLRRR